MASVDRGRNGSGSAVRLRARVSRSSNGDLRGQTKAAGSKDASLAKNAAVENAAEDAVENAAEDAVENEVENAAVVADVATAVEIEARDDRAEPARR